MGTSVKRSTSLKQIVDRAEGYDIPGEIVDGMNFREVRDKIAEIVDSIRKEPHPAFVEVRTYRYRGHSMSDPASYRTKQELEKYRLDDPITRLRAQLTREGKLTNEQFDQLDKQAKETVLAAVKFAEKSPQPPLDKLYDYTYADGVWSRRAACRIRGAAQDAPLHNNVREITYRQALNEALAEELERDPNVFLMGEEVAEYQWRLQSEPGFAPALRADDGSSTLQSVKTDLPASASARRWSACGRSLSS